MPKHRLEAATKKKKKKTLRAIILECFRLGDVQGRLTCNVHLVPVFCCHGEQVWASNSRVALRFGDEVASTK